MFTKASFYPTSSLRQGNRHSLTVLSVEEGHLGVYACHAVNAYGADSKKIEVSGSADANNVHNIDDNGNDDDNDGDNDDDNGDGSGGAMNCGTSVWSILAHFLSRCLQAISQLKI